MKTIKTLAEMGSGCLLLPLMGLAATAAEPAPHAQDYVPDISVAVTDTSEPPVYDALPVMSDELSLPVVGFETAATVSTGRSTAEIDNWNTLNLKAYELGSYEIRDHEIGAYEIEQALEIEETWQLALPFETAAASQAVLAEGAADEVVFNEVNIEPIDSRGYSVEVIEALSAHSGVENPIAETQRLGALLIDIQAEGSRQKVTTLVKGAEDGMGAIALNQWLIPFDDAVKAFELGMTMEANGQIALRSPVVTTHISLETLQNDPDLGKVWSVAEIEHHLGATAEFDRAAYTLNFNQSTLRSIQSEPQPFLPAQIHTAQTYTANSVISLDETSKESSAETTESKSTVAGVVAETVTSETAVSETVTSETVTDSSDSDAYQLPLALETSPELAAKPALGILLVGLAIGDLTTVEATLVKGAEDGEGAIAFEQWLIPFDDAMAALGGSITPQADGLLEIRAPGLATIIDPEQLPNDPELGLAISIGEIEKSLGIPAEFSFSQYAVNFLPPVLESPLYSRLNGPGGGSVSQPVVTQGLPEIAPAPFGISGVRQAAVISGSSESGTGKNRFNTPTGQLSAVGTVLGGSWYAEINQPSISDYRSWQISELQYLRQGESSDYVVGSQPTFWQAPQRSRNLGSRDYWGLTTVQRWGFTSPTPATQGGFSPITRLQSDKIERTVAGEAPPGTLVQLTLGLNGPLVDEVVVNSSGLYRFEDVPARGQLGGQYSGGGYQVQLYANGQLTQAPEIRSAQFTTLPGQLPEGASALIASVGMNRQRQTQRLLGQFDDLQGGLSYRRGLSESLTLGAGLVQGNGTQILTEAFYLPKGVPLQAALSAAIDAGTGSTQVNANVRYQPAKNLKMTFKSDRFSQRFATNWRVSPAFTLSATGNTREKSLGLQARTSYSIARWSGSAMAAIDTQQNLRWRINASNGRLRLSHQGSEISTVSSLSYRLPRSRGAMNLPQISNQLGHELALGYETRRAYTVNDFSDSSFNLPTGNLASAQWRYRSFKQANSGDSQWNVALGYGIGSEGSGLLASGAIALTPGMDLQMRYQGISTFTDTNSFQLSLTSRLRRRQDQSSPVGWGDRQQNRLRTQGGIVFQPFLDDNANGQRDASEALHLESPELMMLVNHNQLASYRHKVQADGILLTLPPDTYRLDLDAAGLPLDRTTVNQAYAIAVVPGQYTPVPIPLMPSYAVSGVVIDADRNAVSGARVEAISASGHRQVSITNGAGVYYLERLQPEQYDLHINGALMEGKQLQLEGETESFLERELHLL